MMFSHTLASYKSIYFNQRPQLTRQIFFTAISVSEMSTPLQLTTLVPDNAGVNVLYIVVTSHMTSSKLG